MESQPVNSESTQFDILRPNFGLSNHRVQTKKMTSLPIFGLSLNLGLSDSLSERLSQKVN